MSPVPDSATSGYALVSEGLATAMEELTMNAGLFEARPRSRELIYVLLAQRGARATGDLMMHANEWTLEQAVKHAVFALRRRHREFVREEVAHTVGSPSEVDEELRHLIAVISS